MTGDAKGFPFLEGKNTPSSRPPKETFGSEDVGTNNSIVSPLLEPKAYISALSCHKKTFYWLLSSISSRCDRI